MTHFLLHLAQSVIQPAPAYMLIDLEALKVVGQVAGIAGLALWVMLRVFRGVVQKNVFSVLPREKSYRLLRLIVVLTWSVAIACLAAWFFSPRPERREEPGEFKLSGFVKDPEGRGLPGAEVSAYGGGTERAQTTSSGGFILLLKRERPAVTRIRADKQGYLPWEENVNVPQTDLVITLRPAETPTPQAHGAPAAGSPGDARRRPATQAAPRQQPMIIDQKAVRASSNEQDD